MPIAVGRPLASAVLFEVWCWVDDRMATNNGELVRGLARDNFPESASGCDLRALDVHPLTRPSFPSCG